MHGCRKSSSGRACWCSSGDTIEPRDMCRSKILPGNATDTQRRSGPRDVVSRGTHKNTYRWQRAMSTIDEQTCSETQHGTQYSSHALAMPTNAGSKVQDPRARYPVSTPSSILLVPKACNCLILQQPCINACPIVATIVDVWSPNMAS